MVRKKEPEEKGKQQVVVRLDPETAVRLKVKVAQDRTTVQRILEESVLAYLKQKKGT